MPVTDISECYQCVTYVLMYSNVLMHSLSLGTTGVNAILIGTPTKSHSAVLLNAHRLWALRALEILSS